MIIIFNTVFVSAKYSVKQKNTSGYSGICSPTYSLKVYCVNEASIMHVITILITLIGSHLVEVEIVSDSRITNHQPSKMSAGGSQREGIY